MGFGAGGGAFFTRQSYRAPPPPPPPPAPPPMPPAPPPVSYDEAKAEYGAVIPISFGTRRMPGQMLYASAVYGTDPDYKVDLLVSFGYNGDSDPSTTTITKLWGGGSRIWTNGDTNLPGDWTVTTYSGTETQTADPMYAAAVGSANAPAFRNQLLASIEGLPLRYFNYVIPGISAEVSVGGGLWGTPAFEYLVKSDNGHTLTNDGDGSFDNSLNVTSANATQYFSTTSKMVFAVELVGVGASETSYIGIAGPVSSGAIAPDLGGLTWSSGGNLRYSGSIVASGFGTFTAGDVLMICFQASNGKIWLGKNGTWFDDPASTETYDSVVTGSPLVPVATLGNDGDEFKFIEWPYALPSGALDWYTDAGGVTGLTIAELLERLAEYATLDPADDLSIDAAITDTAIGALITEDTSYEDVAKRLGRAYGFDMFEAEKITFVKPVSGSTYSVDLTVPVAELGDQGDRAITTTRGEDNSPVQLALSYIDQTQQFHYSTQRARRILFPVRSTQSRRRDGFSIPVVATANTALTLAARTMYREADQNVTHSFILPAEYLPVQPGDILNITADDTAYDVKVTRVEITPEWTVKCEAVNLFADEDIEVISESGTPLAPYQGLLAPVNTVLPTISGTAYIGNTLTATTGTWTGTGLDYDYQWKRGGVAISGATASTYLLVAADVGSTITVTVTASNDTDSTDATSAATAIIESAPINTVLPVISDTTPTQGQSLTVTTGTWTAYPAISGYTYQWRWDDSGLDIAGATNSTYVVQASDVGHTLEVWVTATNTHGAIVASTAATSAVAATTGTLNPSDKHADVTLSGGNLTATKSGAGSAWRSVRSTTSRSSGHHYFEVQFNARTSNLIAGLMNASASLASYAGSDTNGIGQSSIGDYWVNGGSGSALVAVTVGDWVGFDVDLDANTIRFANVTDAPSSPGWTSAIALPAGLTSGAVYAAVSMSDQNDTLTANFGDTTFIINALPSGATAWG